jgi:hypothetical protein
MKARYECYFVLTLAYFLLVWPGCHFYVTLSRPFYDGPAQSLFRVNRLTGEATLVVDPAADALAREQQSKR